MTGKRRLSIVMSATTLPIASVFGVDAPSEGAPRVTVDIASISTPYAGADFAGEAEQITTNGATAIRIPARWCPLHALNSSSFTWTRLDSAVSAAFRKPVGIDES